MLNLQNGHKLSLITGSATDLDVLASFVDRTSAGVQTPGSTPTAITLAATTDIVADPGVAGTIRNVKSILIKNKHATASSAVTPQLNIAGTLYELAPDCTLLAGESLVLDDTGRWTKFDANGQIYQAGMVAASDTQSGIMRLATQAEMETGTASNLGATALNIFWHQSSAKFWVKFAGNTTTINASFNVTSVTDGTTQATVNINLDFSSANWCLLATAIGAAATVAGARLASALTQAAGTIIVFCVDASATQALVDPTSWCVAGWGDV